MKHMGLEGKITCKKWVSRGEMQVIGVKKIRVGNQTRKAKWCKTQAVFLKMN